MRSISLKKFNSILLCGVLLCAVLYFAKKVLIPVTFAAFFAMLFVPMCNFLEKKKIHKAITALISVLITLAVGLGIIFLVYQQGKELAKQFPEMQKKSEKMIQQAESYVEQRFDIPKEQQEQTVKKEAKKMSESSADFIQKSFMGFMDFCAATVLTIIFMFLFLYQREKYESFFMMLSRNPSTEQAKEMIGNISKVSAQYLRGRVLSILIFTVCFTAGFLIVGLKGAFFLAFVSALLTIIPYIGSIIGGLFPFAVALVTEDSSGAAVGALAVILIVQGIDNYFVEPYIIGGQVSISAFFTILILFIGGLLWGVAGMILFIPMLGVFKIICDSIPDLHPYGYLIGDQKEITGESRIVKWFKKKFRKDK